MTLSDTISAMARSRFIGILLLGFALSPLSARAQSQDCTAPPYNGVIDGNVFPNPPSQIQINGLCTIRNFPASNPLTTNFSFLTQPGQTDQCPVAGDQP